MVLILNFCVPGGTLNRRSNEHREPRSPLWRLDSLGVKGVEWINGPISILPFTKSQQCMPSKQCNAMQAISIAILPLSRGGGKPSCPDAFGAGGEINILPLPHHHVLTRKNKCKSWVWLRRGFHWKDQRVTSPSLGIQSRSSWISWTFSCIDFLSYLPFSMTCMNNWDLFVRLSEYIPSYFHPLVSLQRRK